DAAESQSGPGGIARRDRRALLLRWPGVRCRGAQVHDRALRRLADPPRQRLSLRDGRSRSGERAGARRARRGRPPCDQCRERAPLSRAEIIAGSTALIDSWNTASAMPSKGVGSAFTITILAPAPRAS